MRLHSRYLEYLYMHATHEQHAGRAAVKGQYLLLLQDSRGKGGSKECLLVRLVTLSYLHICNGCSSDQGCAAIMTALT